MHTGPFAPWEHYPKYLRQHEVSNPLTVITEFFGINTLGGHKERLQEWRDYVVADACYKNKKHGPSDLLFIYHTNLRLIEALYLLLLQYDSGEFYIPTVTERQLSEERAEWETFPDKLPEPILLDPYKYVRKLFKKFPPESYREILTEWLYFAFSKEPASDTLPAQDIAHIYEAQLNLYAIAWLIYQRTSRNKQLKVKEEPVRANSVLPSVFYNLNSDVSLLEQSLVEKIVREVRNIASNVKGILYLGTSKSNDKSIFLFVVTEDCKGVPNDESAAMIRGVCKSFANVNVLIAKVDNFSSSVLGGNYFYYNMLVNATLIYKDTTLELPQPVMLKASDELKRSERYWQHWYVHSKTNFERANIYTDSGEYSLALLSMHHAVKKALLALLRAVLGYRLSELTLTSLVNLSTMFTADLVNALSLDTADGLKAFKVINDAITDSNFGTSHNIDKLTANAFLANVRKLLEISEAVYLAHRSVLEALG